MAFLLPGYKNEKILLKKRFDCRPETVSRLPVGQWCRKNGTMKLAPGDMALFQYSRRRQSSAVICSLIETAKENGLDP